MSTQNENLFVKLVRKSVGLPTGKSDCCGVTTQNENPAQTCCGSRASDESVESSCGCSDSDADCCGSGNVQSGGCCG